MFWFPIPDPAKIFPFASIDISDPYNPQTINYWTDVPSAHACWTTEDGDYLVSASETGSGHIMIWDVQDLNNINLLSEWTPEGGEWDSAHNVFIRDQYVYISYYRFGLQIIDIADPNDDPNNLLKYCRVLTPVLGINDVITAGSP